MAEISSVREQAAGCELEKKVLVEKGMETQEKTCDAQEFDAKLTLCFQDKNAWKDGNAKLKEKLEQCQGDLTSTSRSLEQVAAGAGQDGAAVKECFDTLKTCKGGKEELMATLLSSEQEQERLLVGCYIGCSLGTYFSG